MPNTYGKAETQKGKAETKTETENHKGKAETETECTCNGQDVEDFAHVLNTCAVNLEWEKREVREHDPEAQIVMHVIDVDLRLQALERKFQDLIDNLRIFMVNDEEENAKK